MSLQKIREAVQAAEGNARQMGEVVLMIAQADVHAAEVIAADLDNPEMSFDKCFSALYEYAKKHQKNYSWCCVCNRFDPENPVIQVVADFYKVRWMAFSLRQSRWRRKPKRLRLNRKNWIL